VSIFGTARSIYTAIKDDPAAIEAARAARSALALALITDPNAAHVVTSATMNGQTFSATAGMKPTQRLEVLKFVCAMADQGFALSTTTQPLL
jgi:hypothetical protein